MSQEHWEYYDMLSVPNLLPVDAAAPWRPRFAVLVRDTLAAAHVYSDMEAARDICVAALRVIGELMDHSNGPPGAAALARVAVDTCMKDCDEYEGRALARAALRAIALLCDSAPGTGANAENH